MSTADSIPHGLLPKRLLPSPYPAVRVSHLPHVSENIICLLVQTQSAIPQEGFMHRHFTWLHDALEVSMPQSR